MRTIILLGLFIVTSCSDRLARCYVCNSMERKQVADFITTNVKPANNMSDEEMEDVISQLEETGVRTHCRQVFIPADWQGSVKLDQVKKKEDETVHPYIY